MMETFYTDNHTIDRTQETASTGTQEVTSSTRDSTQEVTGTQEVTSSTRDTGTQEVTSSLVSEGGRYSRASSTTSSKLTRDDVYFMESQELEEFCYQLFNIIDTNNDGFITEEELLIQCETDDPVLVKSLIQSMDTNNDGKISFDEFREGLLIVSDQLTQEREHSTPKNNTSNNGTVNGYHSDSMYNGYHGDSIYETNVTNSESEEVWSNTMTRIDPTGLLTNNDDVHSMWLELYCNDHSLLERFESFLFNVVSDLQKSQTDVESIQNKIKKLLTEQSREAHEMDDLLQEQLMTAYDKQEKKSQEVTHRISTHYQELLKEREDVIACLSENEKKLKHDLKEKTLTEQELRKEKLHLITLNRSLQDQLTDSYKQLSASQKQLQRISQTYNSESLPWLPGDDPLVETSLVSTGSFDISLPSSINRDVPSLSPPTITVEVEQALKQTTLADKEDTPTDREDTPTPTPTPEIEETVALLHDHEKVGVVNIEEMGVANKTEYSIENSSIMFNKVLQHDNYPSVTPVHFPNTDLFTVSTLLPSPSSRVNDNNSNTPTRVFKVVILGDSGVGKTSLIRRLISPEEQLQSPRSTLGLDYSTVLIELQDENIVFQLWDTAGQERFHSTTAVYFKRADAFIIVYDVCNKSTFINIKSWISLIKATIRTDLPIIMIMGNKSDCSQRQVSKEDGQKIALEIRGLFSETSAVSGHNVLQAHVTLGSLLLERQNQDIENIKRSALRLNSTDNRKRCKC